MTDKYCHPSQENGRILPAAAQACAACKFQRRKCKPNCPLSPFFPATRLNDFQNARKVFGVKNIVKTLQDVDPSLRGVAANSMIVDANLRVLDPIGGSYRIISTLKQKIACLDSELQLVLRQLAFYRNREANDKSVDSGVEDCKPRCFPCLLPDNNLDHNVQNYSDSLTFGQDCFLDESGRTN